MDVADMHRVIARSDQTKIKGIPGKRKLELLSATVSLTIRSVGNRLLAIILSHERSPPGIYANACSPEETEDLVRWETHIRLASANLVLDEIHYSHNGVFSCRHVCWTDF